MSEVSLAQRIEDLKKMRAGILGHTTLSVEELKSEWWPDWAEYMAAALNMTGELLEAAEKSLEPKSYVAVGLNEDASTWVETEGPVAVFNLGQAVEFSVNHPVEEEALSALRWAANLARESRKLPAGRVKQVVENGVVEIFGAYGQFGPVKGLSEDDRGTLALWLPSEVLEGL